MELGIGILIIALAIGIPGKLSSQEIGCSVTNVMQFGAAGDGETDDSQAFVKAWESVCGGGTVPTLVIPAERTFLLQQVEFRGPCRPSAINVQVQGIILAPRGPKSWAGQDTGNWVVFSNVDGLVISGNGKIDGQGQMWWEQAEKLDRRPTALEFVKCNNVQINGLTLVDSQQAHMHITESNNVAVSNLHISAHESSPNTDGIDIGKSTNVWIQDSVIGTGDDCIAINGGSSSIHINSVTCGPGHGISIGSLGAKGRTETVEEVYVRSCTIRGTTNGLRIKTWQGGSGYARKIFYQDITLDAVANPIIIDQFYCIDEQCKNKTEAVKLSDIFYKGVHGTSSKEDAIIFRCSESSSCDNIDLRDIDIRSGVPGQVTRASCSNANGEAISSNPIVDCLSRSSPTHVNFGPPLPFTISGSPTVELLGPRDNPLIILLFLALCLI